MVGAMQGYQVDLQSPQEVWIVACMALIKFVAVSGGLVRVSEGICSNRE